MQIFACPNCQQQLAITPQLAGRQAACPRCRVHLQLPDAAPPPLAQPVHPLLGAQHDPETFAAFESLTPVSSRKAEIQLQNKERKKFWFYLGVFAGGAFGSVLGSTVLTATIVPLSGLLSLLPFSLFGLVLGALVGAVSGFLAFKRGSECGVVVARSAEWMAFMVAIIGILGAVCGNGLATGFVAREMIAHQGTQPQAQGVPLEFTCPATNRAWIGSALGATLGAVSIFFLLPRPENSRKKPFFDGIGSDPEGAFDVLDVDL